MGVPGIEKYAKRVKKIRDQIVVPYQLRRVVVDGVQVPVFRLDFEAQRHLVTSLEDSVGKAILSVADGGPAILVDTRENPHPAAQEWILQHEKEHVRHWLRTGQLYALEPEIAGRGPSRDFWEEVYIELLCAKNFPSTHLNTVGWTVNKEVIHAIRRYLRGPNYREKAKRLIRFLRTEEDSSGW